jgi:hypothetical protein
MNRRGPGIFDRVERPDEGDSAAAQGFLHGDDLDGNVADFGEEAVKD